MGAQHTPGPWSSGTVATDAVFAGGTCLALTGTGIYKAEVNIANARLIAAAPEMLEALARCVDAFAVYADEEDADDQSLGGIILQARAAIAKAEGRS